MKKNKKITIEKTAHNEINEENVNTKTNDFSKLEEIKKFKFDSLTFKQWYEIVQYVINYDIILSNLERLENLLEKKLQLKTFLNTRGIIPEEYKIILEQLNAKYEELLRIQSEISLGDFELSDKIKNEKIAIKLEEELKNQMVNKDNLKIAKEHVLFFRNPYFINGDNQFFEERVKALKKEYRNINYSIKKIKPYVKRYKKKLTLYEDQVKKVIFMSDFQFDKLFKFVRPFITEIISSQDLYYSELVTLSLLD